ncbi:hypothetical protein L195_g048738, partial [Trifolium pratense]
EAFARPSLSELVANSSPQLATACQEPVFHWCGSPLLVKPSLSELFATARHYSLSEQH